MSAEARAAAACARGGAAGARAGASKGSGRPLLLPAAADLSPSQRRPPQQRQRRPQHWKSCCWARRASEAGRQGPEMSAWTLHRTRGLQLRLRLLRQRQRPLLRQRLTPCSVPRLTSPKREQRCWWRCIGSGRAAAAAADSAAAAAESAAAAAGEAAAAAAAAEGSHYFLQQLLLRQLRRFQLVARTPRRRGEGRRS